MSNQKPLKKRRITHKPITRKTKRRKGMKPNPRSHRQPTNITHRSIKPILSNKTLNRPLKWPM